MGKAEKQKSDTLYFQETIAKISNEMKRVQSLSSNALLYDPEIIGRTQTTLSQITGRFEI